MSTKDKAAECEPQAPRLRLKFGLFTVVVLGCDERLRECKLSGPINQFESSEGLEVLTFSMSTHVHALLGKTSVSLRDSALLRIWNLDCFPNSTNLIIFLLRYSNERHTLFLEV